MCEVHKTKDELKIKGINNLFSESELIAFEEASRLNIYRYPLEWEAERGEISLSTLQFFREARQIFYSRMGYYDSLVDDSIADATKDFQFINLNKNTYLIN